MNRDESGLLRAILQEGLLTASQGRRVARAIERGATLEEALGRTPLIDPLDYQKLLRQDAAGAAAQESPGFRPPEREAFAAMERVATYDLADDEGIPLVQRLYELLREAFYGGMGGLEIGRDQMQSGWSRLYDNGGACLEGRALEAAQAEKMIARLRVMGRITPSKKAAQRCLLGLAGNGLQGLVILESEGDVVRLYLDERTAG